MTDRNSADDQRNNDQHEARDGTAGGGPAGNSSPQPVGSRRERYLVALVDGVAPMAAAEPGAGQSLADRVFAQLTADPATTVHRIISSTVPDDPQLAALGLASPPVAAYPKVAVVEMEADRAAMISANPFIQVEPDLPLRYAAPGAATVMTFSDPGVIPPGDEQAVEIVVVGSGGTPIEGAEVYLMNDAFPLRGVTGGDGVTVIVTPAGVLAALTGVYVKPRYDHWAVWLGRPQLTTGAPNLVSCPSIAETLPGFPQRQLDGWARRAMRLDALPPIFRGDGVKIAVIDSGAAVGHPDLATRIIAGRDIPGQDDTGWRVDTVGHGTHTAGIIGGSDNGYGVVGVVPEAEMHSCKIFPGGRFSDLIEALDYCIAHRIDVVNLSLGSPQPSQLIAQKIEQARQSGVACVVAAGNDGGPVAFPASMPTVLAVAAIGKLGEYPPESYHATQVYGVPTADGYFSAKFTCYGPEIDVCAPGVAIVSSVPPANYAAWDGTSFAAPYVTGLAALLLAHHPEFRDRYAARDAARVDRLFEQIRASCRPLALGDPGRSGAGLPDAVVALGVIPPVTTTPPAIPALAELWALMALAGLIPVTVPTVTPAWSAATRPATPWDSVPTPGTPAPTIAVPADAYTADRTTVPAPGETVPAAAPPRLATTLTPLSADALDPLRAAMRAAGLLPHHPRS